MVFTVGNEDRLWTADLKCENCHAVSSYFLKEHEYKKKRLPKWCRDCNNQFQTVHNVKEFMF